MTNEELLNSLRLEQAAVSTRPSTPRTDNESDLRRLIGLLASLFEEGQ